MKINKISANSRHGWVRKPFLSHPYHAWLVDDGSLTARLQQRYADFSVKATSVRHTKPGHEESSLLHLPASSSALIREVLLTGNAHPVIFAHSVLPPQSLRGEWRHLRLLGNSPLGATLFSNPKVKRTPLTFKKLSVHHALYQAAAQHIRETPAYLWARRSVFSLNGASILVTEVFLPALMRC